MQIEKTYICANIEIETERERGEEWSRLWYGDSGASMEKCGGGGKKCKIQYQYLPSPQRHQCISIKKQLLNLGNTFDISKFSTMLHISSQHNLYFKLT